MNDKEKLEWLQAAVNMLVDDNNKKPVVTWTLEVERNPVSPMVMADRIRELEGQLKAKEENLTQLISENALFDKEIFFPMNEKLKAVEGQSEGYIKEIDRLNDLLASCHKDRQLAESNLMEARRENSDRGYKIHHLEKDIATAREGEAVAKKAYEEEVKKQEILLGELARLQHEVYAQGNIIPRVSRRGKAKKPSHDKWFPLSERMPNDGDVVEFKLKGEVGVRVLKGNYFEYEKGEGLHADLECLFHDNEKRLRFEANMVLCWRYPVPEKVQPPMPEGAPQRLSFNALSHKGIPMDEWNRCEVYLPTPGGMVEFGVKHRGDGEPEYRKGKYGANGYFASLWHWKDVSVWRYSRDRS